VLNNKPLNKRLAPLAFESSEIWDSVLYELEEFCIAETAQALDGSNLGETRVHYCGRASALVDFRQHLQDLRSQARSQCV